MAKFDYVEAQSNAAALIDEFGDAGSFTRETLGVENPATGEMSPSATESFGGTVTPLLRFGNAEVNGESVQRGDGYVYFDGDEVLINDYIELNGETWRAVDVTKLTSVGGVRVYQKIQLRR